MQQGPPKKKGMSTGCIIAIVVVLSFFGLVGGIVLYGAYKLSTNKDVQHVMSAIGEAAELATEAQAAPGTNELRAIGCEQAMALDAAKMQKLMGSFMDGGAPPPSAASDVDRIVMCQVGYGTAPTCDDAAKAYAKGASAHGKFMLTVQVSKRTTCSGIYGTGGALVTPLGTSGTKL